MSIKCQQASPAPTNILTSVIFLSFPFYWGRKRWGSNLRHQAPQRVLIPLGQHPEPHPNIFSNCTCNLCYKKCILELLYSKFNIQKWQKRIGVLNISTRMSTVHKRNPFMNPPSTQSPWTLFHLPINKQKPYIVSKILLFDIQYFNSITINLVEEFIPTPFMQKIQEEQIFKANKTQLTKESKEVPEGRGGGEIRGGSHDEERNDGEDELKETQSEAATSTRHALYVLHPRSRHILRRLWRRLHRMHRWPAHVHRCCCCFLLKNPISRTLMFTLLLLLQ